MSKEIKRIYVRRYRDNGQVTAYADYADGSRIESTLAYLDIGRDRVVVTFGTFFHALFNRAKLAGLKMERETW